MEKMSVMMTDNELRKAIYDLRRGLRADIKQVRALSRSSSAIPTTALKHMTDLERQMRAKSVRRSGTKELRQIYRDLRYTRGLKSSSPEGAISVSQTFTPIKEKLDAMSPTLRQKFWYLYSKVYGESRGLMERFKYEEFKTAVENIDIATDVSDLATQIITKFDEVYKELPRHATDEQRRVLFTDKLKTLFK